MQLVKFPSIDQFRTVVKIVRDRAKYHEQPFPTLLFNGSVKLHGSNAGIVKDPRTGEIWCQSREQIITTEKDNAGFARFISELPKQGIDVYFNIAANIYGMNNLKPGDLIGIYGEWCGKGIMKGVAICQLSKRFVVFGIKVYTPGDDEEDGLSHWFSPNQLIAVQDQFDRETQIQFGSDFQSSIYSIQKFKTWTIEIDFAHPELVQNELVKLIDEVENLCPVGKAFDVEGVGEGVVWRCISTYNFKTSDLAFKVKGQKHSDTKVKITATVDIEKVNTINEFASNVVTNHRLEKIVQKMKEADLEIDIKNMGAFMKLVGNDVLKEETDTIEASGLDRKTVMPAVNNLARQWFMQQLQEF